MVKIKMVDGPTKAKKTTRNAVGNPGALTPGNPEAQTAQSSSQDDSSDWKLNVSFNWKEMFDAIDSEIIENGTLESGNAVRALVRFLLIPDSPFNINSMNNRLKALEEIVEKKDSEIEKLKKRITGLQNQNQKTNKDIKKQNETVTIDKFKTRVTLANIPLSNPKGNAETIEETKKTVTELLKATGQSNGAVKEFKRLYPKVKTLPKDVGSTSSSPTGSPVAGNPKRKEPKILLDFQNMTELRIFTSKLRELKKLEKYKSMSLDNDCPKHLLESFLKAKEKGFKLRKEENLLTRTFITKNGIVLKVRKSRDEPYKKIDF